MTYMSLSRGDYKEKKYVYDVLFFHNSFLQENYFKIHLSNFHAFTRVWFKGGLKKVNPNKYFFSDQAFLVNMLK